MLRPEDFVAIPYTSDLTEAGIAYACRSLAYTYNRMGTRLLERLRRIVAGVAAELALRRWLHAQKIPFDTLGETDFTRPDRYDIALAGHRCDLKTFLITRRAQIQALRRDPQQLLQAQALVPLDQHRSHQHAQDIYLFAFIYALLTQSEAEIRKAQKRSQPFYWIYPLPKAWSRPKIWSPLAPLVLKSEEDTPLLLEIGGQTADGSFFSRRLELPPRTRFVLDEPFFSLLYVHAQTRPQGRVGIRSAVRSDACIIQSLDWGNIWVYGLEIHLVGWTTWEEFDLQARALPAGSAVLQYQRTRTRNLALPVAKLRPFTHLLERARTWERTRSK